MNISWLPTSLSKTNGQLGVCALPGSTLSPRDDDLLVLQQGAVRQLVCLVEEHELLRLEPPEHLHERRAAVESFQIEFIFSPIEDFTAPSLRTAVGLVRNIHEELVLGHNVVVHCHAGLGRAGTIAACLLVMSGMSAVDAIHTTRWVRPGAIQTDSQEALIHNFAHHQVEKGPTGKSSARRV